MAERSVGDSWEEFEEVFQNKYIPNSAVNALRRQFEHLTQGDMTVDQYAEQFTNLSRIAPELDEDKEQQFRRFEDGLRPGVRLRVVSHVYTDFAALLESARAVERS